MRSLGIACICVGLVAAASGVVEAQACAPDPALATAAAELLLAADAPSPEQISEAARRAGSDAPVVRGFVSSDSDEGARAAYLARTARSLEAPLGCGEARSDGHSLLLVAPRAGRLVPAEDGRLRVELATGWRSPFVHVRDARGELWQLEAEHGQLVDLPEDLEPPLDVQLVAEGPGGPRPVAERSLGEPAHLEVVDSDEPLSVRLSSLRGSAEAASLRSNRLLEQVAARHAEEVCRDGRVAHLGEGGDPEERLARAGVRARHVGETVSRATSAGAAYAAMLRSPSHRSALTDRRFTDVGIATAADRAGGTCLVFLLAAWPRAVPFHP